MQPQNLLGFTLVELLISLAILGEIAAFTIPKVLNAQQNGTYNAVAKETISTIEGAYQLMLLDGQLTTNSNIGTLTPYLNYTTLDTTSTIDHRYTLGTLTCNTSAPCIRLHNGAVLMYWVSDIFSGSAITKGIPFYIDPDGRVTDNTTNGPGKSLLVLLYYNGRITDLGNASPNTTYKNGGTTKTHNPTPSEVPPWFSW
jgi:prepilin-type N-terminal cleavage/methylation domain-containing protein